MRLTCPRCAAQYEIAESAIPPAGREVECSACGHVWRQARAEKSVVNPVRPLSATASAGGDSATSAVLSRPLDESVLSILREEAEREMRARATEQRAAAADHNPATAEPEPHQEPPATAPEIPEAVEPASDWPATTVTGTESAPPVDKPTSHPAGQPDTPAPTEPAETMQAGPEPDWPDSIAPALPDAEELAATLTRPLIQPSAAPDNAEASYPAKDEDEAPVSLGSPLLRPAAEIEPAAVESAPSPPRPAPVPALIPQPRRSSGYGAGFGLAVLLALGLVALYALTPRLTAGTEGGILTEWREQVDRGRLWLHDRILGE